MLKLKITLFLGIVLLLGASANKVSASEGEVELRNTRGEATRCDVFSVLMPDLNYNVLVTCRNILYPGGTELFVYTMWSTPLDGANPKRLGDLGVGKAMFRTPVAFSSLFVTKEQRTGATRPSEDVVLQGTIKPFDFLDSVSNDTVSPSPDNELGEPEPSPTPKPKSKFSILRVGGIVGFIALFATILLVFILTRR